MTCIVGLAFNGDIYMGADSCSSNDETYEPTTESKVFVKDSFIIGFSGSWRVGQLLAYHFDPPVFMTDSIKKYFVIDFIDNLRHSIKDNIIKDDEFDWEILVGFRGRLFKITDDFHVSERKLDKFDVAGSGSAYADGSMYSTTDLRPKDRIRLALKAAAHFDPAVCGPFIVEKLDAKSRKNMGMDDAYPRR